MRRLLARWLRRGFLGGGLLVVALVAWRVWDSERGPALEPWHTHVPRAELLGGPLAAADWPGWMAAEDQLFDEVAQAVMRPGAPEANGGLNRYDPASAACPCRMPRDWNRSYVLEPSGPPRGAAVFLHGLTDSPYSLRHLAERYRAAGYLAIAIRLPGHGTVPAALTQALWEDWLAAAHLATSEARRRIGPGLPLHLVGFSNGGALAMMQALDGIEGRTAERADRLVLISPMIGITQYARFAGLAGLPAVLPAFAKSAWLGLVPEFNPFKYNSFPVHAARQSYELTQELQRRIQRLQLAGELEKLPPVLTFQSVLDSTTSARALIEALYARLPANGSELVLFDINRASLLGPLFRRSAETMLERLLPPGPRRFRAAVISNAGPGDPAMTEEVTEPGAATPKPTTPLGLDYPADVYSLSHVALPFPPNDGLYGATTDPAEGFPLNLGAIAARGERGALVLGLDALLRLSSNPFYPYLEGRVAALLR
ncbi:carboxylesterase [Roseomonas sp. 18066]|uniref:alpha/beta hydrolase n=1 Tax=Roseomonas sp. 18066 TaxID=2681412 RepID=UPI00135C0078|nr:alpha/beta hydrolase [Roseomonas sp. 18066]